MKHVSVIFTVGLTLVAALPTVSANAQNARSFVSGQGSDSNSCTLAAPCRTLAYAITRTNAGGEILALNPAGYGPVTINKSISIVSSPGAAGVNILTAGTAITINALSTDVVSLRGLTIDGLGIGTTGIQFNSGAYLTVENCVIRHFVGDGIDFSPSSSRAKLSVSNTEVSDNGGDGINVQPVGSGGIAIAVFNRVEANNNVQHGIAVFANLNIGTTTASVSDSIAANNGNTGFLAAAGVVAMGSVSLTVHNSVSVYNGTGISAQGQAFFYIDHSKVAGNSAGWVNQGLLTSYGDNYFDLNGANTGSLAAATKL